MRPPVGLLLSGSLLACAATSPPSELVDAREVLQNARRRDARHQSPADLHEADDALKLAEARFADSPNAELTRATAYMAHRRALWAMSRVNEKNAHAERAAGEQELERLTQAEIAQAQQPFASPKEQLRDANGQAAGPPDVTEKTRRARVDAEQRTNELLEKMDGLVTRLEAGGVVITFSASELFAPGKITLLAAAQQALNDVARAVKDDPRHVAVLGRAETQGNPEANMRIAQARAEAVRAFLISKGVPGDRVNARGTGQPAMDEGSTPGHMHNQRLDIVLGDKPKAEEVVAPP
jgi:outer membrane protein OmpA-like peptidoglycan-associated protein